MKFGLKLCIKPFYNHRQDLAIFQLFSRGLQVVDPSIVFAGHNYQQKALASGVALEMMTVFDETWQNRQVGDLKMMFWEKKSQWPITWMKVNQAILHTGQIFMCQVIFHHYPYPSQFFEVELCRMSLDVDHSWNTKRSNILQIMGYNTQLVLHSHN